MTSNKFQAHPTKTVNSSSSNNTKNALFNMGIMKKEEEHANLTLYNYWVCTNANKLCS